MKLLAVKLVSDSVSAGFPSPAEDSIEQALDLNEYLVNHPAATFFVRVQGESMIGAGIQDGDILVVDKSLPVVDERIVIACLEGEFTVKHLQKRNNRLFLVPDNPVFKPVEINNEMDFIVWGVVTGVIRKFSY